MLRILSDFLFNLKRSFSFKTSFSSKRQGGEFLKEKKRTQKTKLHRSSKRMLSREKKVEKRTFRWSKELFNQIFTFDATGESDSKELVI